MELTQYVSALRRQRRLIVLLCVLGIAVAGVGQVGAVPTYIASAQVLLLPNDPSERITDDPGGVPSIDRYASVQISVMLGRQVSEAAAQLLRTTRDDVLSNVRVSTGSSPDVLLVTAEDIDPIRAAAFANTVSEAYIETRRVEDVAALTAAADQIQDRIDSLTARITELRAGQTNDEAVLAALDATTAQYSSLYSRQQDLLINASLKRGSARVLSAAEPPASPTGRSLPVSAVLGGLLGLVAGLGFALLREKLDDRLRSREEVEAVSGLPVLGELPVDRRALADETFLPMTADRLGQVAEATRSLRTNLSFLSVERPVRRLLISSAQSGDGKTFVAANLASACAQAGMRTVLVAADLRRSRLEAVMDVGDPSEGLSTVLASGSLSVRHRPNTSESGDLLETVRRRLEAAILSTGVAGLDLLPAGVRPPNPAELLGSQRMDLVLDALEEAYDLVIIDACPVLPVADAVALVSKVSGVLLVVDAQQSRRNVLVRLISTLRLTDANLLGIVLNRARPADSIYSGRMEHDRYVPGPVAARRGRKVVQLRRGTATAATGSASVVDD